MPLSITSSTAASTTIRRLNHNVQAAEDQAVKLSTGKRVNGASDNVAVSAIAARLTAEVAGLKQAGVNADQASSLAQIADGAYSNIEDNLIRAKQLAIQAGSETLSDTERSFLDQEFQALLNEIDRIAKDTKFNGQPLIDRSRQTLIPFGTNQMTGVATAMGGAGTFTVAMSVNGQGLEKISFEGLKRTDGMRVNNNGQRFSNVQSLTFAALNLPGPSNVVLNVGNLMVKGEDGNPTTANFIVNATAVPELTVMSNPTNPTEVILGVTMATSVALPNVVAGLTGSAIFQLTSDFELRIPNSPIPATTGTIAVIGEPSRRFDIQVGTGTRPGEDEITLNIGGATTQALDLTGVSIASKVQADRALRDVDDAINVLQARRAELAAAANRLDDVGKYVQLVRENQDAARSALEDLNVGSAIQAFAQKQLLIQSGTSTLTKVRDSLQQLFSALFRNENT